MSELKMFPWENDVKPDFINEEGFEWYQDKETNDYIRKDSSWSSGPKGLTDVFCFFVKKGDQIERVLVDDKQNILKSHTNWEALCAFVDMLKLSKSFG